MNPTTEEMILAAHVRSRAAEIRAARARSVPEEQAAAFMARPVTEFVPDAMAELSVIAELVSQIRQSAQR